MTSRRSLPDLQWVVLLNNGDRVLVASPRRRNAEFAAKLDYGRDSFTAVTLATPEEAVLIRRLGGRLRAGQPLTKKKRERIE